MSTFLRVKNDDKQEIISFLAKNDEIKKKEYEKFFKLQSLISQKNSFYGWCIRDHENKVRGFLGALTHQSPHHKNKLIVNMTNWEVCEKYRSMSLGLLGKFIKNKSHIYTNYSASKDVQKILPYFGFKEIDKGTNVFSSYKSLKFTLSLRLKFGKDAINEFVGTDHEKIINDHLRIGCIFVVSFNRGYLFFKQKKFPFNSFFLIHVINFSTKSFRTDWKKICSFAFFRHLSSKIFIDKRFSPAKIKPCQFKKKKMFMKGELIKSMMLTRAYSEPLQKLMK